MNAIRLLGVWGVVLLSLTSAQAQPIDDIEWLSPADQDIGTTSFAGVWQEDIATVEFPLQSIDLPGDPIEQVSQEEPQPLGISTGDTLVPLSETLRLLPNHFDRSSSRAHSLASSSETLGPVQSGLLRWLLGMLGAVGFIALCGIYWIYQVRPALEARQSTGRLQLSSMLALPRRPGLFLVDIEDQSVLVAIDGGGIRQVVPLELRARSKPKHARSTGDSAPRAPSRRSSGPVAGEESTFRELYHEQAWGPAPSTNSPVETSPLVQSRISTTPFNTH